MFVKTFPSDKCCIQGGRVTVSTTVGVYTYSLLKPYKDTNYHITSTFYGTYGKDFSSNRSIIIVNNSQFSIETRSSTGLNQEWLAIGFVN